MNNADEDVKVKIYIKNKGNLIANATVYLNTNGFGRLALKGFQIWNSQRFNERLKEKINISPPSKSVYGKSVYLLYFENPEGWNRLEQKIHEAYIYQKNYEMVEGHIS